MTDSGKLVDQQLRLVEIKRTLERRGLTAAPASSEEIRYGPCLLLSRECGSAGDELAHRVAGRLHWQVFDREIVEQIADRAHVRNQLVESVDEQVRSRWQALLHPLRERHTLKPKTYLFHLHQIVLSLGHHGYVVIVGRGAQFLLPAACAVRVRVVENIDSRVRQIAFWRQCSGDDARKIVEKCDAASSAFAQDIFHQDPGSPLHYDLLLNSGSLGLNSAVQLILGALEMKLGVKAEPMACGK